jgi:RNA 2',3'-cyclic 3'-phosphodiesterase
LTELAAQIRGRAFSLQLDRSEIWNRALVALMPSAIPPALTELATDLNARLAAAAFPTESRTYRPHVTVIREITRGGGRHHALVSSEESPIASVAWDVDDFVLACSHPGASGSRYEVLHRWPLAR